MVNYLGFEHYRRWDLSRDQKYALSDKTKRFLESLKGKMRITVFFVPQQPDHERCAEFADRISIRCAREDRRRVHRSGAQLSRAKELFDKYKVVTDESVLILDYEGRNKTVKASEMAEMDQGNADARRSAEE